MQRAHSTTAQVGVSSVSRGVSLVETAGESTPRTGMRLTGKMPGAASIAGVLRKPALSRSFVEPRPDHGYYRSPNHVPYSRHNSTPVCILAGGLGTRLGSLTQSLPKPMLPVTGRPFLHLLLEELAGQGLGHFVLAVRHRWEAVRDYFGDGSRWGWRIEYSVEPEPLGTGGATLWAQSAWGERALVVNGDSLVRGDWPAMLEAQAASALPAAMALAWQDDASGFGLVRLEGEGDPNRDASRLGSPCVAGFEEKPAAGCRGWVNAGVYVLTAAALAGRRRGEAFSLERDVFPALAGRMLAWRCREGFVDIGTPESLERFRRQNARAEITGAVLPGGTGFQPVPAQLEKLCHQEANPQVISARPQTTPAKEGTP